jgi:Domain of unknown function (DUF1996)
MNVFRPSAASLLFSVLFLSAWLPGCGNSNASLDSADGSDDAALNNCENINADASFTGVVNNTHTASRSSGSCSRTSVIDVRALRANQAIQVSWGRSIPRSACRNTGLRVDLYVKNANTYSLVQEGSYKWVYYSGTCVTPSFKFDNLTEGNDYRVVASSATQATGYRNPILFATVAGTTVRGSSNSTGGSTGSTGGSTGSTGATGSTASTGTMGSTGAGGTTSSTTGSGAGPDGPYPRGDAGSSSFDVRDTDESPTALQEFGSFRNVCKPSHYAKDDPLVFPGQAGKAHLHVFFGNTGTNAASTYDSLRASGNGTCRGGIANRSAYWAPALLNNGRLLQPIESNFYYKTAYQGLKPADMNDIPNGLRMIAGDAKATPSSPQSQSIAWWTCHNHYTERGHTDGITDCRDFRNDPADALEQVIAFPQCWNGRDVDSPDHKSHMAYGTGSGCPSTHPVAIPEVSTLIEYKWTEDMYVQNLRLASDAYSGGAGGFSNHADYFEAWDPATRKLFIDGCDRASADCHSHLLGCSSPGDQCKMIF